MVIKIIAHGFFIGENSYLRIGWNIMDGALVFISFIDAAVMIHGNINSTQELGSKSRILGMLRVFRLLRTLRALTGCRYNSARSLRLHSKFILFQSLTERLD